MRGLGRFLVLCLGMVLLLACCLVTFVMGVSLVGMYLLGNGPWFLLGFPLAVALLVGGLRLCSTCLPDVTSSDGPVEQMFLAFAGIAVLVMLVALLPGAMGGPQLYQTYYGEKTTAVVTSIITTNNESGGITKYHYSVRDDVTGEDLGTLAQAPWDDTKRGDRIEIVVDPHGWVPPVTADRVGHSTVAAITLTVCFAVIILQALAVLATALWRWVLARPRRVA
jgi:hypothetical protein